MTFLKKSYTLLGMLLVLSLMACTTDAPTDVGDALVTSGDVVTFEVTLPAGSFLVADSSFSGYAKAFNAAFDLVANKYEGAVDAHALYRFLLPPRVLQVRNSAGAAVNDSAITYFSGRMVLKLDTLVTPRTTPMLLTAYQTAQVWDATATWTNRIDSAFVHLPWTTAGGTRGPQIDTATWAAGDSIVLRVDSQTIATWNDTTNLSRGALIVSETNGSRLHVLSAVVHLSAHSVIRPDTVIAVDVVPSIRTFVFDPTLPPTTTDLRVGGIPSWRAILQLRPDLTTITVPCGSGPVGCTVPLDSAHISSAQLILRPKRPPAGFLLEDTSFIDVRPLAVSPTVPIERSPIGARVALSSPIAPSLFTNPAATDVVRLDVTSFLVHFTNSAVKPEDRLAPFLTLLQIPEPGSFGFMSFEPSPSLRLILTAATERQ